MDIPVVEFKHPGKLRERPEYIRQLQTFVRNLQMTSTNLDNKFSLLIALGDACYEAYNFNDANANYEQALKLVTDLGFDELKGYLYFQMGLAQQRCRNWNQALIQFLNCLSVAGDLQMGSVHHQIGMVYQEQRKWLKALKNYEEALGWKKSTGQNHDLGGTYHQIGRVYEESGDLPKALEFYQLSADNMKLKSR